MVSHATSNPPKLYMCNAIHDGTTTTTCTDVGTWYDILSTWSDGNSKGFSVATDGLITYSGKTGVSFQWVAMAMVKADKNCELTFAFELNGTPVTSNTFPLTFNNANSNAAVAGTGIMSLTDGDELRAIVKSDVASTVVTPSNLNISLQGDL